MIFNYREVISKEVDYSNLSNISLCLKYICKTTQTGLLYEFNVFIHMRTSTWVSMNWVKILHVLSVVQKLNRIQILYLVDI